MAPPLGIIRQPSMIINGAQIDYAQYTPNKSLQATAIRLSVLTII
jgi:hypothetical protein